MNGCIVKRKLKSGVSWGYSFFAGWDENGKRIQVFKSGLATKEAAARAQREAIAEFETKTGRVIQEIGMLKRRSWSYVLGDKKVVGFESREAADIGLKDFVAALQAQAIRATEEEEAKRNAAVVAKASVPTVSEYFTHWMTKHASRVCAPKTLERYHELGRYFVRYLGEIQIDSLVTEQIQTMVQTLEDAGGRATKDCPNGRPLSSKTVRHVATLLYTLFAEAMRLGVLKVHPMANKCIKLPKVVKRRPQVLDNEKLRILFDRARSTRLYPFIVLASATGCRRGELLALEWTDLNESSGEIEVSKSLEQTKAGGLRVKCTKSEEPRKFTVPEWALVVLQEHKIQQEGDRQLFGPDYASHNLIFCQPNGAFYSPDRLGARVVEIMQKAGLQGVSLHSLRHSHATSLLSNGVPLAVVSERLGHADQNITLAIYSHALPADTKAAAQVWSNSMADVIAAARKFPPTRVLANVSTGKRHNLQLVANKRN